MRQFLLIKVTQRENFALEVQRVLTGYGSIVLVRLGLHEQGSSPEGIIFLEVNPQGEVTQLVTELEKIPGVVVKLIEI